MTPVLQVLEVGRRSGETRQARVERTENGREIKGID